MATQSPTSRTLKLFRDDGWTAAVTERWNAHAKIRQDLFGFIDIVAMRQGFGIVGVQATSGANVAKRIAKIRELPDHETWLKAGGRIFVIGWRKVGPRGKTKKWQPRIVELYLNSNGEHEIADLSL